MLAEKTFVNHRDENRADQPELARQISALNNLEDYEHEYPPSVY